MRITFVSKVVGTHVHCRVYMNGALLGNLTFKADEWTAFKANTEDNPFFTFEEDI